MEFTDYYATLGVARGATPAQIKSAYRTLARRLHPDVNGDPNAEARFKRVNEAYEVLKDPEKRAKYDRLGANWEELERQEEAMRQARSTRRARSRTGAPSGAGAGYSDFFETFFGGAGGGLDLDELLRQASASSGGRTTFEFQTGAGQATPLSRRGRDIEQDVDISLEEAARGGVRLLTVGPRQVEVRIPAGVAEGSVVRVAGEGGRGSADGEAGDVLLRVRLRPHGRFSARERDLLGTVTVRDDQAVLGARVSVEGLSGPLLVTVPQGTQPGQTLRLRGKGLPGVKGAASGDLLLTVQVTIPRAPGADERRLYEQLAALRGDPEAVRPAQ